MFDLKQGPRPRAVAFAVAMALGLSGCGGGGGANVRPTADTSAFAGGVVNVNSGEITTWSNDVTGQIDLRKGGAGTLVLTGTNSYTGGTKIDTGTLQLGNGGLTGSITGKVVDNGLLVFNRSDDVTFKGIIIGTGSVEKAGKNTLILTGDSLYSGGTSISNGILQIGNGGIGGSIIGDVLNNGSLVFDRSADPAQSGIFSGTISGSGSVVQNGTDKVALAADNTYSGGTTINSGTLQIGHYGATGSIIGDVTNNGTLEFSRGDDTSFAGIVSGHGMLVKTGEGKLTLTGSQTYTGGTGVGGGTLEVAPGASLGTGSVTVGIPIPFYFSKHILQVDSGVSLSNHIVLNGGTLDNAGILGSTLGPGVEGSGPLATILNHDGGSIKGNNSAVAFAFSGTVENSRGGLLEGGSFGVAIGDGGVVSNDGINSIVRAAGGMAIQITGDSGTVINTGGGTITSHLTPLWLEHGGTVTNGAGSTIEATGARDGDCASTGICSIFVASGDSTASGAHGGLTLNNAGNIIGNVQLIPTAYNNATLSAGSSLHGDLLLGSNSGGFLTLNGEAGTVQLYSQAVTGTTTFAGVLSKKGSGSWIIDNDDLDQVVQAYVEGGTLQLGDGGTSGQVGSAMSSYYAPTQIQIASGAQLVFDRSDDVVFWGHVAPLDSGAGGVVVQRGTGDLEFPDLRWIGGLALVIEHGSVTLGDGSFQNDYVRPVSVTNNGSLTFDNDGEVYLESVISGSGSLIKQGPGILSLDGTNTYTGSTTVGEGTLRALEILPGDATVNPGAVLQGVTYNGTRVGLPGTTGDLSNAGRLEVASGDARVGGNYTNATTGTLAVSLGSKLDVTGTATLNGGTLEITGADSGYVSNTHTDVLTAGGGVTGTFDQLLKDTGVVFTATTIHYDANSVWLDTTGLNVTTAAAGMGVSYSPASMGSAQRVQGAFVQLNDKMASGKLSGVSKDFAHAAGQFQQAPTLHAAQASLQSLSGQLHAASAAMTFNAIDASSRALSDRFDNLLDKNAAFGMWAQNLNVGGDMARAGFDSVGFQLNGWLIGSDRQLGHSGVAGYAFGQSRGQQRLLQSFDHDNSRSTEGMLYAGWHNNNWYTQGRMGFGQFQQDVSRQLLLGQSTQGVRTQYNGNYDVAYGESGLHFERGGSRVTPFINAEYARINRDGFAEQGAGGFGLRSGTQTLDRWQAGVGVRANHRWDFGRDRSVDFSTRVQWQRTLASHGDVFNASFVGMQQWQPLIGVGLSRYSGLLGVGLDAKLSARTALKFSYDYEMGQHDQAQMLSARFTMAF
ncbi:MAG: autotransporter domain-containing protein [Rhodanobacter sp.]